MTFFYGKAPPLLFPMLAAMLYAATANVVYGSRGLWGIALVRLIGHWFQNTEPQKRSRLVVTIRIIGATLIATAALVFLC